VTGMRAKQGDSLAVIADSLSDLADVATRLALPLDTPSLAEIMPTINDPYRRGCAALRELKEALDGD
jgi:hypothetical protein